MHEAGPELIVTGGKIHCGGAPPAGGAPREAMAIEGGLVKAVGAPDDIATMQGRRTRILHLEGRTVLPGFCDSHTHFFEGSIGYAVELDDVADRDDFRKRVGDALNGLPAGEWLIGGYWNKEKWGGEWPDRGWIDDLSPRNPVLLHCRDFHTAVCNTLALKAAGIGRDTPDPEGGRILRGKDGEPTGLMIEAAVKPVKQAVPPPSFETVRSVMARWMSRANALGITHIVDMIPDPEAFGVYLDLEREGRLTCRFDLYPPLRFWERFARAGLRSGIGLELVHLGGMKAFVDGSLGSHTALMLEPYDDEPGNYGLLSDLADPPSELGAMMLCADRAGFQLAVHAIGDAANRILLDLFKRVREGSPYPNLRHRVEHAQHLQPADIPRFAELDLIVSVQPYHLYEDGCLAERWIGAERCRWTYPFRSLLDSGAKLAFGSDWPVVGLGPLKAIKAAVSRQTSDGRNPGGWVPEQRIAISEALLAGCYNGAYATGHERHWGSLHPGMEADFVMIDGDLETSHPDDIERVGVEQTYLRGRRVFPERDPE
jgi:predicted amidohydrolase YtcJ